MQWCVSVPGIARSSTKVLCWLSCVFTDCSSCSQRDSVTWILSCDMALTLLICVSLLCFVIYQRKRDSRDSNDGKGQRRLTGEERGEVSLLHRNFSLCLGELTTGRPKQAPSLAKRKMVEIPESPYQVNKRSTCFVNVL